MDIHQSLQISVLMPFLIVILLKKIDAYMNSANIYNTKISFKEAKL